MKVNIKGLVFVGFAAAILSGAAKADDKQIVTSKSYTDATYQTKIAGGTEAGKVVVAGETAGAPTYLAFDDTPTASSTNLVKSGAIQAAIAASQTATTYTSDGTTITKTGNQFSATTGSIAENGGNLVTSGTIHTALAGKQNNLGGTANQIPVTTSSAGTVNYKDIESTAANVDTTTHADSIPTTGAVAGAISSAISNLNSGGTYEVTENKAESIIDSGEGANASSTTEYASNAAVTGWAQKKLSGTDGQLVTYGATAGAVGSATLGTAALTIKQNNVANSTTFGANATEAVTINLATPDWNAASDAAGYIANKPNVEVTGNKVTTITSGSNDTQYPSAAAVYSYVTGLPSNGYPALPTGADACTDAAPCALVATTSGATWVKMAQPAAQ